jgi:hypothetical protein
MKRKQRNEDGPSFFDHSDSADPLNCERMEEERKQYNKRRRFQPSLIPSKKPLVFFGYEFYPDNRPPPCEFNWIICNTSNFLLEDKGTSY